MIELTDRQLAGTLVNASLRERKALTPPADLSSMAFGQLDYLGWRDPKVPAQGYVIVELDGDPVGIMLRQAERRIRSRPQCSWCEDVHLPNDVVLFSARRAGQAGRNGDTIATLACAEFECPANVRRLAPIAYVGFDAEAARVRRIESLGRNVRNFVRDVRDGT